MMQHRKSLFTIAKKGLKFIMTRGLLVVMGMVFALIMVEVGIRLYERQVVTSQEQRAIVEYGHPWGWGHKPELQSRQLTPGIGEHILTTNSYGWIDHEYPLEKPVNSFRILLLGDSMGADYRVPLDNYYHVLAEEQLNETLERPIELLHIGVAGWSTDQQLVYYQEMGRQFDPDLVIVAFCLCNDVIGNYSQWSYSNKPTFALEDGELVQVRFASTENESEANRVVGDFDAAASGNDDLSLPLYMRRWASENLYTFKYLRRFSNRGPFLNRLLIKLGLREEIRFIHRIFLAEPSPEIEEAWAVSKALLRHLKEEVQADGADLAVLAIHSPYQVEGSYWWEPEFELFPAMNEIDWDLEKPNTVLEEFLQQEGIPYYFFVDGFSDYVSQTGNLTTWEDDLHWNLAGQQLAGELMTDWLLSSGQIQEME